MRTLALSHRTEAPRQALGARSVRYHVAGLQAEGDVSSINVGRVVMAGVAAGAVLTACDFVVNNFILNEAWERVQQARNVEVAAAGGTGELIKFIVIDVLLGFLIAWVYAAIRPRLGPGPGTAATAALAVFAVSALSIATFAGWMFSWDLFIKSSFFGLISMLAAGWAAGWVYSENDSGNTFA